jgi:hypothetical protein
MRCSPLENLRGLPDASKASRSGSESSERKVSGFICAARYLSPPYKAVADSLQTRSEPEEHGVGYFDVG